ncbi:MAG: AAA family ATPase [Methylohalobius sp.]|nr:AAA family ATPase [Methylohalobius sp.]
MSELMLPPLISSLLKPSVYDHPTTSIRCLETHISWIILTGPYAYKIKKPVNLGFLDFSTLDKRHFYCWEELRLNRRLAPQLYLAVVAITGDPSSPRIGGGGQILEYAVKMRQFNRHHLLAALAERGELTETHLEVLAEKIARFHQSVPQATARDPYGDPKQIQESVRQNFAQIDCSEPESLFLLTELAAWSEEQFSALEADIAERKHQGFIRECHGDLPLGNIVLWQGSVLPFDCIEFNPTLRWIDTICEIAFTVMDLSAHGLRPLGFGFLNSYLGLTGDYSGVRLLTYYLVYRAMVRAKIAYLTSRQHPQETSHLEGFQRYLRLAKALSQGHKPFLCITYGFSGSGKSYLSRQLASFLGALHLRSDLERKRLAGLEATARTHAPIAGGIYRPDFTERTYQKLEEEACAILTSGFPAIVDATFLKRAHRQRFYRLAENLRLPFLILEFQAEEEILRERVQQRLRHGRDPSEASLEVLDHQLTHYDPLDTWEQALCVVFDTSRETPLEERLAIIKARLGLK